MLEQLLDWLIEEDILKGSGEIAKKASLGEWDSQCRDTSTPVDRQVLVRWVCPIAHILAPISLGT